MNALIVFVMLVGFVSAGCSLVRSIWFPGPRTLSEFEEMVGTKRLFMDAYLRAVERGK